MLPASDVIAFGSTCRDFRQLILSSWVWIRLFRQQSCEWRMRSIRGSFRPEPERGSQRDQSKTRDPENLSSLLLPTNNNDQRAKTERGQRRKKDENAVATEASEVEKMAIKEERRCHIESTVSENLREEVSEAQDKSFRECGGVVSLPRDPGLCDGAPAELSWPIIGQHQSNDVPESHDHVRVCRDVPQEHVGKRAEDICAPSVLADQNSHFDQDIETEEKPLSDPSQANAIGEIAESKTKSLDCSRNQRPEDNCERTEINIMEATMDYNEWMNGGSVEMNKSISSSGKGPNGAAGLGDAGTAEQCRQESADSNLAKISVAKEPGATLALFDGGSASKRSAAVRPTPQTVAVSFCVHYITHSPLQLLAVAGNQQELGNWERFLPLRRAKDGFWANSIALPADSHVEWKFVVAENGRIRRWEECKNRRLQTGCEEVIHLHKWWGCV
ncbi:hypothetical protein SKAU_G00357260 [Synaphobranchus kaupii]|uniref:Starch-binding domain-containing protein 1 n=1 Tax=Synaphobranchus kaupii TaxID=118154 RepID=A0A9Q1IFR4_SYNKA|nr:hypothetical protein SKAU_G00357260 [Synaphobranchus kaupii]